MFIFPIKLQYNRTIMQMHNSKRRETKRKQCLISSRLRGIDHNGWTTVQSDVMVRLMRRNLCGYRRCQSETEIDGVASEARCFPLSRMDTVGKSLQVRAFREGLLVYLKRHQSINALVCLSSLGDWTGSKSVNDLAEDKETQNSDREKSSRDYFHHV